MGTDYEKNMKVKSPVWHIPRKHCLVGSGVQFWISGQEWHPVFPTVCERMTGMAVTPKAETMHGCWYMGHHGMMGEWLMCGRCPVFAEWHGATVEGRQCM